MNFKKLVPLLVLGLASIAQAQIQHVEMRVEGMT
jgi:hypothetical protein